MKNINKLTAQFRHGNEVTADGTLEQIVTVEKLRNYSTSSKVESVVSVHFEDIADVFCDLAHNHEVAVGAVAWLTNQNILKAFASLRRIAIIVQKEDFMRHDAGDGNLAYRKKKLYPLYDALKPFDFGDLVETYPGQQELNPHFNSAVQNWLFDASGDFQHYGEAIKCIGYINDGKRASPRMHHKFVVFGSLSEGLVIRPNCVVTGSFNLTENAELSRENILVIKDQKICSSFVSEWAQLWAMSESLNWIDPMPVVPELYMGT